MNLQEAIKIHLQNSSLSCKVCSEYTLDSLYVLSVLNFFIKTPVKEISASLELLASDILINRAMELPYSFFPH